MERQEIKDKLEKQIFIENYFEQPVKIIIWH